MSSKFPNKLFVFICIQLLTLENEGKIKHLRGKFPKYPSKGIPSLDFFFFF